MRKLIETGGIIGAFLAMGGFILQLVQTVYEILSYYREDRFPIDVGWYQNILTISETILPWVLIPLILLLTVMVIFRNDDSKKIKNTFIYVVISIGIIILLLNLFVNINKTAITITDLNSRQEEIIKTQAQIIKTQAQQIEIADNQESEINGLQKSITDIEGTIQVIDERLPTSTPSPTLVPSVILNETFDNNIRGWFDDTELGASDWYAELSIEKDNKGNSYLGYDLECFRESSDPDCTSKLPFPDGIGEYSDFTIDVKFYIESTTSQPDTFIGIRFRESSTQESYLIQFNPQGKYRFIYIDQDGNFNVEFIKYNDNLVRGTGSENINQITLNIHGNTFSIHSNDVHIEDIVDNRISGAAPIFIHLQASENNKLNTRVDEITLFR